MSSSLRIISGTVSNLQIHRGDEEFIRSANQRAMGAGAAVGLAASGMAGAAVGASIAAASTGDAVDFFACRIAELDVEGRFSRSTFKNGEDVEAVTEHNGYTQLVLAVRRRSDKTLWMVPHCSRGRKAHIWFSLRMAVGVFISLFILIGIIGGIMELRSDEAVDLKFTMFWISLHAFLSVTMAIYFSARFYRQWLPISKQAERIFAALGYTDPAKVDLPRDHKRYCKANGIKWPYLTDGPWIYHYLDPHNRE